MSSRLEKGFLFGLFETTTKGTVLRFCGHDQADFDKKGINVGEVIEDQEKGSRLVLLKKLNPRTKDNKVWSKLFEDWYQEASQTLCIPQNNLSAPRTITQPET